MIKLTIRQRLIHVLVYIVAIVICSLLSIEVGSELVTQYTLHVHYDGTSHAELGEDLGFGLLLVMWLIPELIIGVAAGVFVAKRLLNTYYSRAT
ncbi:hypothetical protein ACFSJY_15125 [Thalassotalea euphylliae]|uniref:hypothetical protein n=1 Tax=Thalassotalea euphylliae TaxID=1655234 RepID=UPI0036268CA5